MSNFEPEVPINYEALARAYTDQLQSIHQLTMQQLGGTRFVGPAVRKKLTPVAFLPERFFVAVAIALEDLPTLAAFSPGSASRMRQVGPMTESVTEMAERHEFLARACRETLAVLRGEAGEDALRIYTVAKGHNRVRDLQQFVPHVQAMKAALGRSGTRAKKDVDETAALKGVK